MTKVVDEQFQLGDVVIYLPEGLVARIESFVWEQDLTNNQHPPKLIAYELSIGVRALRQEMRLFDEHRDNYHQTRANRRPH